MGATGRKGFQECLSGGNPQDDGPYTDIWAQNNSQRQERKHSFLSKDDQLIEGGVWAAELQEHNEVTEEVGDNIVSTEGQSDQEERVQQGNATGDDPGGSHQQHTQALPHDGGVV